MLKAILLRVVLLLSVTFILLLLSSCSRSLNHPPIIVEVTLSPTNKIVGENVNVRIEALDEDNDTLIFDVSVKYSGGILFEKSWLGVSSVPFQFSFIPTEGGTHTLIATVTDEKGASDTKQVEFQVVGNQAPQIIDMSITPEEKEVGKKLTLIVRAEDEDVMNFHVVIHSPSGARIEGEGTGTTDIPFRYEFIPNEVGKYTVDITVEDPQGESDHLSYEFWVGPSVGNPVCFLNISPRITRVGSQVSLVLSGQQGNGSIKKSEIAILDYPETYRSTDNYIITLEFTPQVPGEFTAVGTVTSMDGRTAECSGTFTAILSKNIAPQVTMYFSTDTIICCTDLTLHYDIVDDKKIATVTLFIRYIDCDTRQPTTLVYTQLINSDDESSVVRIKHPCTSEVDATLVAFDYESSKTVVHKNARVIDLTAPLIEFGLRSLSGENLRYTSTRDLRTVNWCVNEDITRFATVIDECSSFTLFYDFEGLKGLTNVLKMKTFKATTLPPDLKDYRAIFVATDSAGNSSAFYATVSVDKIDPYLDLDVPTKLCATSILKINYSATDHHFKEGLIQIMSLDTLFKDEHGIYTPILSFPITEGTGQEKPVEFYGDLADSTVTIIATDECGNFGQISKVVKLDNVFGNVELSTMTMNFDSSYIQKFLSGQLPSPTILGTIVDLSGVCTISIASDCRGINWDIEIPNFQKCSTSVSIIATLNSIDRTISNFSTRCSITITATDCCCCQNGDTCDCNSSSRNSTKVRIEITAYETQPPTIVVSIEPTKTCGDDITVKGTITDDSPIAYASLTTLGPVKMIDNTLDDLDFQNLTPTHVTFIATLQPLTADYFFPPAFLIVSAIDMFVNIASNTSTIVVDTKFGSLTLLPTDTKATKTAILIGGALDLSGVCTISATLDKLKESTLELEATDFSTCSYSVPFKIDLNFPDTDATTVHLIVTATDCCCCEDTKTCDCSDDMRSSADVMATIAVDNLFRYASMTVPTKTCGEPLTLKGTITDGSSISYATLVIQPPIICLRIEDENLTDQVGSKNITFKATLEPMKVDRCEATVALITWDSFFNATRISKKIVLDDKLGMITHGLTDSTITKSTPTSILSGQISDNSSLCEATIIHDFDGESTNATLSFNTYMPNFDPCSTNLVNYSITVSVDDPLGSGEIYGTVTITIIATDCCCCSGISCDCDDPTRNSTRSSFTIDVRYLNNP